MDEPMMMAEGVTVKPEVIFGARFTVRLKALVTTEKPVESTTVAITEKLPGAEGEHANVDVVPLQPVGSPAYEYV